MNLKAFIAHLERRLAMGPSTVNSVAGAPFTGGPEDPGSLGTQGAEKGAVEAGPKGLGGIGGSPKPRGNTRLTGP